jgi:hypothetical protein
MLNEKQLLGVEASVTLYMANKINKAPEWKEDLTQETVLVLLEGYGGAKIEGDMRYAVQMAATRMGWSSSCTEKTGHDFNIEEGKAPSGRRNTEDDFVQQAEIRDWIEGKLDGEQASIVKLLMLGYTQEEVAAYFGLDQSAISRKLKAIQKLTKEDFDVN